MIKYWIRQVSMGMWGRIANFNSFYYSFISAQNNVLWHFHTWVRCTFAHIYPSWYTLVLPPTYPPLCWFAFNAIIKQQNQKQLGRNGFVGSCVLIIIHHRGKSDRNLRQEPGGRNWTRGHGGTLACSTWFLCYPGKPAHCGLWCIHCQLGSPT